MSRFTVERFSTIQQGVEAYTLKTGAATVYNAIVYDGKVVTLEQVYRTSWGDIVRRRVPDGRLKAALLDALRGHITRFPTDDQFMAALGPCGK